MSQTAGAGGHRPVWRRSDWIYLGLLLSVAVPAGLYVYLRPAWEGGAQPRVSVRRVSGDANAVAFSPDGAVLASADGGTVVLRDPRTLAPLATLGGGHGAVTALAFAPNGKTLASATGNGAVKIWDVTQRRERAGFACGTDGVLGLAFSPDGKTLAAGAYDSEICLWDLSRNVPRKLSIDGPIYSVAFSPDGKMLICGASSLVGLDVPGGAVRYRTDLNWGAQQIAFARDTKTLAVLGHNDVRVYIFDPETGKERATLNAATDLSRNWAIAFAPDGQTLAVGGERGLLRLWHVPTETSRAVLKRRRGGLIAGLAFSPDGRTLVSGAQGSIDLWDMADMPAAASTFDGPAQQKFDGPSDRLERTVIVPTLDSPVPAGRSAVWCAAFPMAWKRLEHLAGGPVQVDNAAPAVALLNQAQDPETDLVPGSYYAAAGFGKDGVSRRIRAEMAKQFPDVPVAEVPDNDRWARVFGYLEAGVRFSYDFYDNTEWLEFRDSAGGKTPVRSFGIRESESGTGKDTFRGQVRVLFRDGADYALDLCCNSDPSRIVVARVPWRGTLAATLDDVKGRSRGTAKELSDVATLLVPNLDLRVEHRFRELEGQDRRLINPPLAREGFWIDSASELIRFKLDRHGAELKAGVDMRLVNDGLDTDPNVFHFDRPFLIYLEKRGTARPYFAMWVDNAELLCTK